RALRGPRPGQRQAAGGVPARVPRRGRRGGPGDPRARARPGAGRPGRDPRRRPPGRGAGSGHADRGSARPALRGRHRGQRLMGALAGFSRRAWAVLWKDLVVERRAKEGANALAFFAVLLLFLFYLALGPDQERIRSALAGLVSLAFRLAGVLALGPPSARARENACPAGLIPAPGAKAGLYLGKVAGTPALMLAMEVAFIVATGVLYNLDLWAAVPRLLLIALAGSIGFAAVGTLFAAM